MRSRHNLNLMNLNLKLNTVQAYLPTSADLDYPNKLINLAQSRSPPPNTAPPGGSGVGGLGGGGVGGIWLPVLPKTLGCLSQLYRVVDKKIFEGLAQDAVQVC